MPVALPFVPSFPNYRVSTTLEGVQYIFDVRWNARAESWYCDISTEADVRIKSGVKVVLGAPLGKRGGSADMPPGVFIANDTTGAGQEATIADLGTRVEVIYLTLEEIEAIVTS